ncbi:MAG: hypothetical protein A2499_08140 [Stygiobacter sp. RIFOXYC12_FULL_38_8]|nr:MAG: hypothetical protein A2X62_05325 [Stygiobacter sp. GWC2_38_9]OGU78778.1 MAG: hypothetical protein A2279_04095 [Stygiobacter sp. RIFOXYA12_FULL_38_9]OGV07344.1 MAG: hypothetical protein A2299_04665 [Stygiobacter sp. RIFOXYB2_FULL_37_11]OGV15863.1 MAG: hypothetical protein A2440_01890 [Stygiobacter sp. RIFOXYC2_FULL_38_25]OGV16178.1 MAG: hypothetical protein A2237_12175 [Stygiobacter sp. RIFOXYA2_FULL_38_8]OGV28380.1 MAG: hypothetical protein A2499_08140 [Stygiobacter sp. RIFOXYC12_FULL_
MPLTAMLLTDEMKWSPFDFIAAWILFFSAGLTYKLIARKMENKTYKAAVGLAAATALFLVWSNLAVGLIGNEDNPANWMYIGVLAIGFLGSIIARLQPKGMAKVLFIMALSHALIAAIALIARLDIAPESSVVEILGVNGFFAVLWVGSALLFWNAAQEQKTLENGTA